MIVRHFGLAFGFIVVTFLPRASLATTRPASVPRDYVFIPGGWTHPSCIHEVPNGAEINGGDVSLNGVPVAHYEPCAYTPIAASGVEGTRVDGSDVAATPASVGSGNGPASYGGWVEDTVQFTPSSQVISWLNENFYVPYPPSQNGATLYYFPGLQSTVTSPCGILQPVLQYGVSPAGGGNYWAIGSWWWSVPWQYHTGLSQVNTNDEIFGEMSTSGACSPNCGFHYLVKAEDTNSGAIQQFYANSSCQWNAVFPAVFEVDTGHPLSNCNQLPASVQTSFTGLQMWTGPATAPWTAYNSMAYAPLQQFPIGTSSPVCSWSITELLSTGSTTLWQ
jgi:hypothetical protein